MSPNIYLNASAHHASFIAPVPVFTLRSVPRLSRMWAGNYVGIFIPAITQTRDTKRPGAEGGALRDFPVPTVHCPGSPRVPAATFTLGLRTPRSQPEYFIPGQISDGRRDGDWRLRGF